jgi:T4 RnlA family RNA ligase
MNLNLSNLNQLIQENYIKVQKHPSEELYIYNYTAKAQYDRVWNECTLNCRGLILNQKMEVIARPFPKFFNLGEQEDQYIPNEVFEVYEKMDGSLGVLYWIDNKPYMATRGSFDSHQAVKANELLHSKYAKSLDKLNPQFTYLFEIIYPENRIVVDYGSEEMLILLAVIDTQTGAEQQLVDIGFPIVKKYDGINDIGALKTMEAENKEGFVIRFKSGYRLKVKFEEYQRIHRIVTNVSSISIWEYLRDEKDWGDILERVPDEFYQWVKNTRQQLIDQYQAILNQAQQDYKVLETRKETALYFQTCQYPSVMFNLLTGKRVNETIWKMIRPKFEKPFMNTEEI